MYTSHPAHSVIKIKFLSHDPYLLKYKLSALVYMAATRELEEESFQVESTVRGHHILRLFGLLYLVRIGMSNLKEIILLMLMP